MSPAFDIARDELEILLAEAEEQLQTLDEGLVRLEQAGSDPQLLQAIFRAAHTLKGNAGIINHWRMADLTHALETVLDGLRKGNLQVSPEMVDACLETLDALKLLHGELTSEAPAAIEIAPLVTRLLAFSQPQAHAAPPADRLPGPASNGQPGSGLFICADIAPDSIAPAARALQVVLALQALGEVRDLQPPQAVIESAAPVRRVTAYLLTGYPLDHIRRTLTALSEITRVVIGEEEIQLASGSGNHPAPPGEEQTTPTGNKAVSPDSLRLGEILVKDGQITAAQLEAALQEQADLPGREAMLGQTLVRLGALTQETLDRAIARQTQQLRSALQAAQSGPSPHGAEKTVRTSVERLDNLMNLVGELITDRNRLIQVHDDFENRPARDGNGHALVDNLAQTVIHLGRITDQLQEEVMRIRMLPIANVFHKFPRLVRDLARQAEKQVELMVRGEDTELDRSVIEEISDPLVHLLRNAIAHGLEPPAERAASGKPERGTILLTARHEESRIILTVEDDGRGIDAAKVKASAVQKGLMGEAEAAALSHAETLELIFLPGLSTTSTVDGVAGRGVGMDIVRSNIERLNGNILIETWPGRGTRFTIMLPLTLATILTLRVRVAESTFAIPLVTVMETLRLPTAALHTIRGRPVTQLRGHVLPLVRLSSALALSPGGAEPPPGTGYHYVVAVRWGSLEMGLLVDAFVGEQELVVKSLGPLIGEAPGISGAAILGDGSVTLIVDVPGLFKLTGL